jgi:tungstate transport system substrate-binding protein
VTANSTSQKIVIPDGNPISMFLTDSSTFILQRSELPNLKVLYRGGQLLMNPYHTLWLTDPTPGTPTAQRFATHLMSEDMQNEE